jgi:CheY-like chemotaxis protein
MRVLVVDSYPDAADSLALVLQLAGHEAVAAYDGLSGWEQACALRPDAVVTDLALPGLDGYELARRLRAQPEAGPVRLIALTGYGQEHYRQRAAEAGFDHFLVKLCEPRVVIDLLAGKSA